jgi:hypothetical protein
LMPGARAGKKGLPSTAAAAVEPGPCARRLGGLLLEEGGGGGGGDVGGGGGGAAGPGGV